jgi:hypothetical protein
MPTATMGTPSLCDVCVGYPVVIPRDALDSSKKLVNLTGHDGEPQSAETPSSTAIDISAISRM